MPYGPAFWDAEEYPLYDIPASRDTALITWWTHAL